MRIRIRAEIPGIQVFVCLFMAAVFLIQAYAEPASAAERPGPLKVIIEPENAGPGDILVITLKNVSGPVEGKFLGKKLYFNESKDSLKAVMGIDLSVEPGRYPLMIRAADKDISRTITVSRKDYPIQRLRLPRDMVILSPENEARVEAERKRMAAIWPVESMRMWNGGFINPLPGREISTPFGVRRIINSIPKNPHTGVDLVADEGDPVFAPNDGVAILVDEQFYSGKTLVIDHGQGIYTMYFHLSRINVQQGQAVLKGDVIGHVGSTGRSTGPHLHWGVRIQGARVDPLKLIQLNLD